MNPRELNTKKMKRMRKMVGEGLIIWITVIMVLLVAGVLVIGNEGHNEEKHYRMDNHDEP
jgi:hypothetical protein